MSSLQYRKDRMTQMANNWQMEKVRDLFIRKQVPQKLYSGLSSIKLATRLHQLRIKKLYSKANSFLGTTPPFGVTFNLSCLLASNLFINSASSGVYSKCKARAI